MKKLLLLLLFFPCMSHAATWYVDNSCANNGDGTSTACAASSGGHGPWNSLLNAANSCASVVSAGDHIQIRKGVGVYTEQVSSGAASFQPTCSGSSAGAGTASTPIYYENYPGDNVIIDGSKDIHSQSWTAIGGGVYQCTSGCAPAAGSGSWAWIAFWVPGAGGVEQEIYTDQTQSGCTSSVPAGWMWGTSTSVCVHLPDGSSPASATSFKIPYVTYGLDIGDHHLHDVVIQRNPSGGSFSIRRMWYDTISGSASANYNLVISGLDIGYAINRCIDIDNGNYPPSYPLTAWAQNNTYNYNHVHHCGQEGMHVGDDTLNTIIDYNEFDHIQIPPWFQYCNNNCGPHFTDKGVAIRDWCFNAGNYCEVKGNIFHDSGGGLAGRFSALDLEYGALNVLVANNLIYNLGPLGTSEASPGYGAAGFQLTSYGSYPGCGTSSAPCLFENNRIYNVDDCANFETPGSYYMSWYNNTCANFSDSVFTIEQADGGNATGTINLVNNIFYWSPTAGQTSGPITGFLVGGSSGNFNITGAFANNSFYCTQGCSGTIVNWPTGTTYTSSTITSVGKNTWGNPNISLTATALPYDALGAGSSGTYCPYNCWKGPVPFMNITTTSGSAYQQGQVLSPTFPDSLGTARPTSGAWDIGAIQYQTLPTLPAPASLQLQ